MKNYLSGETMRSSSSRFRHRAYNICRNWCLDRQLSSALHADIVNHLSFENTISPREINVFENAEGLSFRFGAFDDVNSADAVSRHLDYLPWEYFANVLGPDGKEPAGFGRHYPTVGFTTFVTFII